MFHTSSLQSTRQPMGEQMDPDHFFSTEILLGIDKTVAKIISGKPQGEKYLTHPEFQQVTIEVRENFDKAFGKVPKLVEAACLMAESVIAPSKRERARLLKSAVSVGGGVTGITLVLAGVATALGWTTGALGFVTAFFVGASLNPLFTIAGGAALTALVGYFMIATGKPAAVSDKAVRVLKSSLVKSESHIMEDFGK